jgi:hypothetical protein
MLRRIGLAGVLIFLSAALAAAQTSPGASELKITGAVSTPLTLTAADLKNMPRTTLQRYERSRQKRRDLRGCTT